MKCCYWFKAFLVAVSALLCAIGMSAQAQTFSVLYSFAGLPDGANPWGSLIMDSTGNLYGTTQTGGAYGFGTVFKLDTSGNETVLHSFSGPEGSEPVGTTLVRDAVGNIYGTTEHGGVGGPYSGLGVVFKLDASGTLTVLHYFSGAPADGSSPGGTLIMDSTGNFYGTTRSGGADDYGTMFKLDASGTLTVLHSFTGPDGANPSGVLSMDAAGNLYGTTQNGGAYDSGTVFKLDASGIETVLYSFNAYGYYSDGGTLIRDAAGNLYGLSGFGGTYNYGFVFKLDTSGTLTVLHTFTGPDGSYPDGGLIMDSTGNFYGTTGAGGADNAGTVFELDTSGTYSVLHSFTGSYGTGPEGGVIMDASGYLYGTTFGTFDGSGGYGTVFKLLGAAPTGPVIGTVTALAGVVTDNGKTLAIGDTVRQNDVLETSATSQVTITFVDGTTITLGPNAKISLDEYVYDPNTNQGQTSFSWLRGLFEWTSGKMDHLKPNLVHTIEGILGIRGTQFIASYLYAPDGVTITGVEVDLIDGSVDITPTQTGITTTYTAPITIVFDSTGSTGSPLTQDEYNAVKARLFPPPLVNVFFPPPSGQSGFFKAGQTAVSGSVSATDPSNVAAIFCSDSLNGLSAGALVGGGTGTASRSLSVTGDGVHNISCAATDGAGNIGATAGSMNTAIVEIDTTPPTVTFSGNQGTYTVDQEVNISCSAADALSGVASTTCTNINGPAYSFKLGKNTFSATATDNAGNTGAGSTTFTVNVTYGSLSNLVTQFVTKAGIANALLAKLLAAQASAARGNASAMDGQLGAFINEVSAESGKSLTAAQAATLVSDAAQLEF